jgi:hypothetical protein
MKRAVFVIALVLAPLRASADAESDLRAAIDALFRTSHTWETTTRQRFNGETTEPRVNPNAPLEVQGKFDPNGYTQITLLASRGFPVAVTAVTRQSDTVAQTPLGWLRRTQIHQSAGPDREISFEGKPVRLSRALSTALKAAALRTPTDDLLDLLNDLKSCRTQDGLILVELRDRTVEKLWGDAQARRAPEIQGTVIVKVSEAGVTEYHVVVAIGFPNSRTKKVAWQMQQWSTRITDIGTTSVEPPPDAVKTLAE